MTKEEFNNLSPSSIEDFINDGGVIEQSNGDNLKEVSYVNVAVPSSGNKKLSSLLSLGAQSPHSIETPVISREKQVGTSSPGLGYEVKELSSPPVSICFDVQDPVELLFLLDDSVANKEITLYDWQMQFLLDFAAGGQSDSNPFQAVVRACNGSGKDKYLIAPCAVWLCMRYYYARCVITSSSGIQLDNQTCAYIEQLCLAANRKFGQIWKCNYRYYECLASESPMVCYATDEPGKAEGFHPLKYGAKMAILVSEDKSVPDDINIALNKCTGYTHRIHVSTPGNAFGHFYNLCSVAVSRSNLKSVKEAKPEDYIQYVITRKPINMCPHLTESHIKVLERDLPGGANGAAFKSQVCAEFATTNEMVVISHNHIWKAKQLKDDRWIQEPYNKAGLDLSDGGDETVLVVRNGNKMLNIIPFRLDNTEDTVSFLNEKFHEHSLTNPESYIFADCGGIGKPILDRLKRQGWVNIRYRDNRARSSRPKTYRNWGVESWFHFGSLLEKEEILILDDPKLISQLSTRYYKIIDGAIHQLLSKVEMRSRGYPSPDRADACILAFCDYHSTITNEITEDNRPFKSPEINIKPVNDFSLKVSSLPNGYYRGKLKINNGQKDFSLLEEEIAEYNRNIIVER